MYINATPIPAPASMDKPSSTDRRMVDSLARLFVLRVFWVGGRGTVFLRGCMSRFAQIAAGLDRVVESVLQIPAAVMLQDAAGFGGAGAGAHGNERLALVERLLVVTGLFFADAESGQR